MTTKHTPGPWSYHDTSLLITSAEYDVAQPLKLPGHENHGDVRAEQRANAHLIAAAPELLAALQEVLRLTAGDYRDAHPEAWDRASAAIAKATGE